MNCYAEGYTKALRKDKKKKNIEGPINLLVNLRWNGTLAEGVPVEVTTAGVLPIGFSQNIISSFLISRRN